MCTCVCTYMPQYLLKLLIFVAQEHFTALIFILIFLLSQRGMLDTFVLQYKAETKAISPSPLTAGKIAVDQNPNLADV